MDMDVTKVTVNYKVPERVKKLLPRGAFDFMDTSERCGIFIYSHKLTPKTLVLNSEDFILDGVKYGRMLLTNKGPIIMDENDKPHQHESDWWINELSPYKECCEKIDEFGWKCGQVNLGDTFEWDFSTLLPTSEFIEFSKRRNSFFTSNTAVLTEKL